MSSSAEAHWTDGIAKPIYEMLDRGASNEEIDRFLRARRAGDLESAQLVLSEVERPAPSRASSRPASPAGIALMGIRVAALRPVVNELTAQELLHYIDFVSRASTLLVEAHADVAVWENRAAVHAAGSSLSQAALKWLRRR